MGAPTAASGSRIEIIEIDLGSTRFLYSFDYLLNYIRYKLDFTHVIINDYVYFL